MYGTLAGDVILRRRIEIVLAAAAPAARCPDTSGAASTTPSLYLSGGISPEKTFQRHWSISSPNGRNAIFSSALFSSRPMSFDVSGRLSSSPMLHQVLRRDRQRDGVADGFVESVVGAVAEQERLLVVGALVEVVAQLVMDGGEILGGDVDAHLDAQIVHEVDVPGAGVAHHVAVARLDEQRAFPERLRQRRESERREKNRSPYCTISSGSVFRCLQDLRSDRSPDRRPAGATSG